MSAMSALGRTILLVAALSPTAASEGSRAGPGEPNWSIIVVQQRPELILWDADRKIEPGAIGLVYMVEQVEGSNLLLCAPGRGLRGWTPSDAVFSLKLGEEFFTLATGIQPDDPFAYMMRAIVRLEKGNSDDALCDLEEAARLDPEYVPGLVRFAAVSATWASELAGWKIPRYLTTLTAACSETGDFAAPVHNRKRAVGLLGDGAPESAESHRLPDRYRPKKPPHALGLFHGTGNPERPGAPDGGLMESILRRKG
jgi:hypothetical protein